MLDIRLVSIQESVEGDERSTIQRLQAAFGVDARIARFFLANIPIFVKRNASTDEARAYVQTLHQIGAEVEIHRSASAAAVQSADRFQPDAMERLRAAQEEEPASYDERPDRFPDSVAPFMDEVPDAFPASMDIRDMTSPPGFDSRLGFDEVEELMSVMPDDSSIGPLTMDLPDGKSLDAFEAFGLSEEELDEFDEFGEIDAMAQLSDEDMPGFPTRSAPIKSSAQGNTANVKMGPAGPSDFDLDNDISDLSDQHMPLITGNEPPPPEEPAGLSAPIPFPEDLLDDVGPDVDPAAISASPASAPSFTSDIDQLLAARGPSPSTTMEEDINDLFPGGVPTTPLPGRRTGPASPRTTQPELPTVPRATYPDNVNPQPQVPANITQDPGVGPLPAVPVHLPVAPAAPALPKELQQVPTQARARVSPPFWSAVPRALASPLRGAGVLWLGLFLGLAILAGVVLGYSFYLAASVIPIFIVGLARYFSAATNQGLDDDPTAPPLNGEEIARIWDGSGLPTWTMTVLFAVVFALPAYAVWNLVSTAEADTEASAPLTEWDPDQEWWDEDGKPLDIEPGAGATVAYDEFGAKVLVDPRRQVIHHIDAPRSQKEDPDVPMNALAFLMLALLLPLAYWPMALTIGTISGSAGVAFNPIKVLSAIVKGGIPYVFVALLGMLIALPVLGVTASLFSSAVVSDSKFLYLVALVVFGLGIPYVHGVQGQLLGRLVGEREDVFAAFAQ